MGRRLRSAALALPLLAAAAGAGCGADEASAAEIVRGAAATTVEASTARMTFEVSLPEGAGAGAGTMTGEGAMDFEREIGTMTFDLGPVLEASGEQVPAGTDTEIQMVFDGTTYYLRFPMLAQAFGGEGAAAGKEWIKIDGAEAAAQLGIDLSEIEQMGNDPRQQLAYLTGVSDDVEEVGEDDVRGEATTHYRGTVRIDDVMAQLEEQDGIVDVERFRDQVEAAGMDEMDFDVWVDDEGRARRMVTAVPLPPDAGAGAGDGEVEVTLEMFDFGAEVEAAPPPADQVLDITELATQGG